MVHVAVCVKHHGLSRAVKLDYVSAPATGCQLTLNALIVLELLGEVQRDLEPVVGLRVTSVCYNTPRDTASQQPTCSIRLVLPRVRNTYPAGAKLLALLGWLVCLALGLLKRRLGEAWGGPDLYLDVLLVIDAVGKEEGREVDLGKVASLRGWVRERSNRQGVCTCYIRQTGRDGRGGKAGSCTLSDAGEGWADERVAMSCLEIQHLRASLLCTGYDSCWL